MKRVGGLQVKGYKYIENYSGVIMKLEVEIIMAIFLIIVRKNISTRNNIIIQLLIDFRNIVQ